MLTASELIKRDGCTAERTMKEFISALTAKHLMEMRRGRLPTGVLSVKHRHTRDYDKWYTAAGIKQLQCVRKGEELIIEFTIQEYEKRLGKHTDKVILEDCGVAGEWIEVRSQVKPYCEFPIVQTTLVRVY